jgi:hypothetical protein
VAGARAALVKGVPTIVDLGDWHAIPVGLSALAGLAAKEPKCSRESVGARASYVAFGRCMARVS